MQGEQSQALYYLLAVFKKKNSGSGGESLGPGTFPGRSPGGRACPRAVPAPSLGSIHQAAGRVSPSALESWGALLGRGRGTSPSAPQPPVSFPSPGGHPGLSAGISPPWSPHGPGNLELHGCQFRVPLGFLQPCLLLLG